MAVKTGQKTFNMNLKVSGDNVEKVEALIADHAIFLFFYLKDFINKIYIGV